MKRSPRIGLALGSGSAKGLAHIGVIKVLEENNIPVHYVAGSSIGAVLGAYYALHPSFNALKDLVYRISERKLSSVIDITFKGGIIKGLKIEKLFGEMYGDASFDSMNIPLAAVATDLSNADVVVFKTGNLIQGLRASISIPGFLRPAEYEGRFLADGGLSNPVPVDVVREMGADITVAVNLDTLYVKNELVTMPPLPRIPARSIDILRHHLALKSARTAEVKIAPLVYSGIIAWRDFFTREKIDLFIAEGERAANEALPELLEKIATFGDDKPHSFLKRVSFFFRGLGNR